jgi:hypothetical protein
MVRHTSVWCCDTVFHQAKYFEHAEPQHTIGEEEANHEPSVLGEYDAQFDVQFFDYGVTIKHTPFDDGCELAHTRFENVGGLV